MEYQLHYPNDLSTLENGCETNSELKIELGVLKNYVEHLEELNSVLINTVMELQKEVEERVAQMESRIQSSAKSTMEAVLNLHEWEQEMNRLITDRQRLESLNSDLQCEISTLVAENNFLKDQNSNYIHDVQVLLHLIQHARTTGCWEVDNLMFCEVTAEQVFGPVLSLDVMNIHSSKEQYKSVCGESDHQNTMHEEHLMLPSCKELLKRGFSVPELYSSTAVIPSNGVSRCDSMCCKRTDIHPSRSVDLFYFRQNAMIKNIARRTPSFEVSHGGFSNGPDLHRTYSEPYLFIFDDKIFYYKPCESTNQEMLLKEVSRFSCGVCQSVEQKLPDIVSRPKGNLFCDYKAQNSSFSHCSLEQESLNSVSSRSNDDGDILVNSDGEIREIHSSSSCECLQKDVEDDYLFLPERVCHRNSEMCYTIQCGVQTDDYLFSENLQAGAPNGNCVPPVDQNCVLNENCEEPNDENQNHNSHVIRNGSLGNSDKECEQAILIKELQLHISNLIRKLELKEEEIEEFKLQVKVLQDQKRSLLIQLDSQGDKLEIKTNELTDAKHQLQRNKDEIEQQSTIIKSLQDALVECKRAFDSKNNVKPFLLRSSKSSVESQSVQTSRGTIVDL